MTDRPYTDADLRAEAARQHKTATEDPDFMGIGEQMDGSFIDSTVVDPDPDSETGTTWNQLDRDDFDAAQRGIDDLLTGAADLSEWAINLGADDLEPVGDCFSMVGASDKKPVLRVHFAFTPDMPEDVRQALINGVAQSIANEL